MLSVIYTRRMSSMQTTYIYIIETVETVVRCPRSLLTLRNQNHFVCDDNDAYSDVRLGRTVHSVEFADTC